MHLWDFQSYVISVYIFLVVPPIILSVGIVGNAMAAIVLLQKTMRSSTSSMYLIALAFVDTTVLLTGLVRLWIRHGITPYREYFGDWTMGRWDIREYTDAGCKIHSFMIYTTVHISAWLLVCLAVERVIAVFVPLKVKLICTHKVTLATIGAIFLVCIALNSHIFNTIKLNTDEDPGPFGCGVNGDENSTNFRWDKTYQIIDAVVASYAPFIIMLSANLLIIGRLKFNKYKRGKMVSNSSTDDSKLNTMTTILLTINFVFVVTTGPVAVLKQYYFEWFDLYTDKGVADNELAFAICDMLFYMNSALNFILYCISGPRFRGELMVLLRRLMPCIKRSVTETQRQNAHNTQRTQSTQNTRI